MYEFVVCSPIVLSLKKTFFSISGKMIPFGNNIRIKRELTPKIETDEEKERLVQQLVDKLTIDFNLNMLPNPKYRKKVQYVKSKLLNEPYEDTVVPFNRSSLDDRIQEEVDRIKAAFKISEIRTDKRKKPANPATNAKKKKN